MTTSPLPQPESVGDGAIIYRRALNDHDQKSLSGWTMAACNAAGWLAPVTPGGKPFSVRQMNFGPLGWVSDRRGYRYQADHPETGQPWPAMPDTITDLWNACLPDAPEPQCCLVNHYTDSARMGLHRDADEEDQTVPLMTLSLGAPARFRLGRPERGGPTRSFVLDSGDILIMGGTSRRAYHGIDKLLPADALFSPDLGFDGRLSLTVRRVTS
ncbi:alpha-ketoglutarate-dependent dioxygenase AlkB [Parvularcula sp. LCG005]|uniref:alpha-ketoglutarate-dependent dioxygenase AlkB n=1 Tax=Parvularcula sp. LCG005 TaxID=3078805 RepID=UPI002941D893|nr:alpha-ketoglutarate-dependent dioxygenase AlkB [Parvularcula sp. LCG005]WOI52970.1 alpha-ketoglutarate-dependent dioxygenase AlkB [Parvularcula sp. LCG005]